MPPVLQILFPPFRLDLTNEQVWRDGELLPLRPKPFAVLRYLVEHPGRLVTREELVKAVWPQICVSEGVLRKYIHDLRAVLADEAAVPQFIETVGRRGYRWIASLHPAPPMQNAKFKVQNLESPSPPHPFTPSSPLVGRDREIAQLHQWLQTTLSGTRQLVFVTGEPGIGKTTLVDVFLQQAASEERLWIGRGQCIEHYSASEAYLPVLEALGRLCRGPDGARLIALLRQHAPTWLMQMPALMNEEALESVQRRSAGATQERMLREMAQTLEELTMEQPLVLWLEDLHGSDYATLDLLAFLARRREPARLLVIGTYRPLAVRSGEHPLPTIQHELQVRGQCSELALEPLAEGAVAEYLAARFAVGATHASPLREMAQVIHQRTEGNPLFMVSVVETVLRQEKLGSGIEAVNQAVPTNIRYFIEQQVEQMRSEEREVLEVASVAGREGSAAVIAAGLEERVEEVEQRYASLAQRGQFIRASGIEEWPDGTVATRYRFIHALYQEVLYEGVTAARQVSLHRRIGERLEQGYGQRAGEVATELAMHFERGRDYKRAVQYLHLAGETALQRHAYQEAVTFLTKGVALLQMLPETSARRQQELALLIALGPALIATRGYADVEVEKIYTRALALCQQIGETPQLFSALGGLWSFSLVRAEHQTAHELGRQLLRLALQAEDPALLVEAHHTLGASQCLMGEWAGAQKHLARGLACYDPQQHHTLAFRYAYDPGVVCLSVTAWVLWFRGYPHQALTKAHEALALARQFSHPFSHGLALFCSTVVAQHCHHLSQVAQWTDEAMALSTAQGFPVYSAYGLILKSALMVRQGQRKAGIEQMQQGLATYRATGAECLRPYFLGLLADAYDAAGQGEEGLVVLAEALEIVEKTGERFYEAELWRLKGQLTLQQFQVPGSKFKACPERSRRIQSRKSESRKSKVGNPQSACPLRRRATHSPQLEEAEACFHKAIEIARHQEAKSLELRAVTSLSRLWQQQGKKKQACKLLAEIYGWFTEGFDTADLQKAGRLLKDLH